MKIQIATLGLLMSVSTAFAGSVGGAAPCQAGSIGSYLSSGFVCNVGSVDVFNFTLEMDTGNGFEAASPYALAQLHILPSVNSSDGSSTLFVGGFPLFQVDASTSLGWRLGFTVDPPPIITGETLEIDPPYGEILGHQLYCMDGTFANGCPASGLVQFSIGSPAVLTFAPALATLDTLTTFYLNPNQTTASGMDALVFNFQTTAATPEPSAWLLAAGGLAFLARYRRR